SVGIGHEDITSTRVGRSNPAKECRRGTLICDARGSVWSCQQPVKGTQAKQPCSATLGILGNLHSEGATGRLVVAIPIPLAEGAGLLVSRRFSRLKDKRGRHDASARDGVPARRIGLLLSCACHIERGFDERFNL